MGPKGETRSCSFCGCQVLEGPAGRVSGCRGRPQALAGEKGIPAARVAAGTLTELHGRDVSPSSAGATGSLDNISPLSPGSI